MTKLDDILSEFVAHDMYKDWEKSMQPKTKQQIKNLMLELIGEDEELRQPARYEVAPGTKYFEVPDNATHHANNFRWELRQKVEEL